MDAVFSGVLGSAHSCVLEAGSDREDRCHVGDTGRSLSAKNDEWYEDPLI